jgi:hypothetical protein
MCNASGDSIQAKKVFVTIPWDKWALPHKVWSLCTRSIPLTMQEAFRLLKGWYWAASETVARPCLQTMARQMEEWVELYWRRDSPGEPLPIKLQGPMIPDKVPSDHKIRDTTWDLTSGHRGGGIKNAHGGHQKMATRHYVGGGP